VAVAGPGSGKTSTLVGRIKCLLLTQPEPVNIVAITFTNKAAAEIQKRLGETKLGYLGTLHGWCLRLIQKHGTILGYGETVTILADDDTDAILAEVAASCNCKTPVSKLKELRDKQGIVSRPRTPQEIVLSRYAQRLRSESAVDFGLLLTDALQLVKIPAVQDALGIDFLFVDEFQDSGPEDYAIYQTIPVRNKFFVGDPDQAIYGFRGGRLENILELCEAPDTTVIPMEGNYRSLTTICEAAQKLIEHNAQRYAKQTVAIRTGRRAIRVAQVETEYDEIRQIAGWCRTHLDLGNVAPEEIAILARRNDTVNAIASELKASGLPVREKPKVSDENRHVRACIEVMRNPDSNFATAKYIAARKGPERLAEIRRLSRLESMPLFEYIRGDEYFELCRPAWGDELLQKLTRLGFNKADLQPVQQAMRRISNPDLGLLSLALQSDEPEDTGAGLTVTTIHGAKGLEFEHVWVAAADQETIPGRSDVEEERRLFYVAITRAKDELVISTRKCRKVQFNPKMPITLEPCTPSQFIKEAGLA
jgi:DNA helicase II / ATP-dependent DNA helicase PcrA